jgi:GTP cyclohydrolase I
MSNKEEYTSGYSKIDRYNEDKIEAVATHYKDILSQLGEDPEREGLIKTPERVAKALQYLTHGYDLKPDEILKSAMFEEDYSQMVVVKDIEVYSMCNTTCFHFLVKCILRISLTVISLA